MENTQAVVNTSLTSCRSYYSGRLSGIPINVTGINQTNFMDTGFSFDTWFYPKGESYEILSIEGFITIRMEHDKFCVSGLEIESKKSFPKTYM